MPAIVALLEEYRAFLIGTQTDTYLHGECYAFAMALHKGLGWQMVGLMNDQVPEHVGVRSPDGRIFDARGYVTEDTFAQPYLRPPYIFQNVEEDDLRSIRPVHEHSIYRATCFAEMIWPELPWTTPTSSRILAFVDALEQLSRAHGIWIRESSPSSFPLIYVGDETEKGYQIRPFMSARTFSLERQLGNDN